MRSHVASLLVCCGLYALSPDPLVRLAAADKVPSYDQALEFKTAANPKISPDGKKVVYELSRTNWEGDSFDTDLWIADVATGESHPLTAQIKSSTDAAWSPNGKWIAFLSDRPGQLPSTPEGKKQLYVIPRDGGEARQLTKLEGGVNALDWAPDSQHIAISAEDSEPKAMKDRKEKYGDFFVVHADYHMVHLWLVDLPSAPGAPGAPRRITR